MSLDAIDIAILKEKVKNAITFDVKKIN